MSQVAVTKDNLTEKRLRTSSQEHAISCEDGFRKWQRSDVTKPDLVKKIVGFATYPILGIWGIIVGLMFLVLTGLRYIFRLMGSLLG